MIRLYEKDEEGYCALAVDHDSKEVGKQIIMVPRQEWRKLREIEKKVISVKQV